LTTLALRAAEPPPETSRAAEADKQPSTEGARSRSEGKEDHAPTSRVMSATV